MTRAYRFVSRPEEAEHQHPFLVFDGQDQLHVPLTIFGKEALVRVSKQTAQGYLYAILPFFSYVENDVWQVRAGRQWKNPPHQVRQTVEDYLVHSLRCKVQTHRHGFQLVFITSGTHSTIRIFLSGLKLFYQIMYQRGYYSFSNPLVDAMTTTIAAIEARLEREDERPRMPEVSGVVDARPKNRLSDSYFKLTHEDWVPQIIDDPLLPHLIIDGGKKLPLKGRRLREECITWILFESGARISEVTGLMLGDWVARGMLREANTFNKGSHGRRTKFISFSHETVKLLKRYFDSERRQVDLNNYTLDDYLLRTKTRKIDLQTVPLFLSAQRTPLTAKEYREHYWNPACQAAGIEADVHQSRHWHVTCEVRDIYETSKSKEEIQRRLHGLVEYMKWKSKETLEVYEHYFDKQFHDETLEHLHARMHEDVQDRLEKRQQRPAPAKKVHSTSQVGSVALDEPDLEFLYSLGGER
jgi:integrase